METACLGCGHEHSRVRHRRCRAPRRVRQFAVPRHRVTRRYVQGGPRAILWDVDGAAFHCAPGAGTLRNLSLTEGEPATLVFPGPDADTHSWLVDSIGRVDPDDDGWAILTYKSGVLHRPAPGAPGDQRHC